jgi:hypothetical protein
MSNITRKLQRNKEKELDKEVSKKVGLFNLLPDKCHICEKPYDRKSKEMAQTWFVNVFADEKIVDLFCPDCWSKVNENKS